MVFCAESAWSCSAHWGWVFLLCSLLVHPFNPGAQLCFGWKRPMLSFPSCSSPGWTWAMVAWRSYFNIMQIEMWSPFSAAPFLGHGGWHEFQCTLSSLIFHRTEQDYEIDSASFLGCYWTNTFLMRLLPVMWGQPLAHWECLYSKVKYETPCYNPQSPRIIRSKFCSSDIDISLRCKWIWLSKDAQSWMLNISLVTKEIFLLTLYWEFSFEPCEDFEVLPSALRSKTRCLDTMLRCFNNSSYPLSWNTTVNKRSFIPLISAGKQDQKSCIYLGCCDHCGQHHLFKQCRWKGWSAHNELMIFSGPPGLWLQQMDRQKRCWLKCLREGGIFRHISKAPISGFKNWVGNPPLFATETLIQILHVGLKFLDFLE